MSDRFRKLRMEQMEQRQMMAGDVFAYMQDGNLYINEAPAQIGGDNGISITRLANGMIRLEGHDPTNSGGPASLVNGQAFADFSVPYVPPWGTGGNLYVNLGGGEDQMVFNPGSNGPASFQNVELNVGASAGHDPDRIIVNALSVRGSLKVNTGAGDDWVFLSNTTVGSLLGRDFVSIRTGAGADTVTMKNDTLIHGSVDIQTYSYLNETDADTVYFDTNTVVDGDINVRTGGGADNFLVTNPNHSLIFWGGITTHGSLNVDTGAHNDFVYARGVKTDGNFRLFTGAGADNVTIDNRAIELFDGTFFVPRVGGNMEVQTYYSIAENQADVVSIYDASIVGSLLVRLGGGNDTFLLEDADFIGNDFDLNAGAGNDTATLSAFVVDHLMSWMGDGDDTLTLGATWAYRLISDGGWLGTDRLFTSANTSAQYFDTFNWEFINRRRPHNHLAELASDAVFAQI
jgi:hypothetical protein